METITFGSPAHFHSPLHPVAMHESTVMASENDNSFTQEDFEELSEIYAEEYNNEEIHDRILVFDIVEDERNEIFVVTTDYSQPTTSDEEGRDDKSPPSSSAGSKCVLKPQKEEVLVYLPEVTELLHRKRPSEEEDNPLSKRPREDLSLESESDTDTKHAENHLLPRKDVITIDADTRIGSEKEATEMNDEPQSSCQTSTNPSESQVLRQHEIFVHTILLAVHSKYFRSLFYSGMKESTAKEVHMKVPESEEKGHLMMLEAVYRPYILETASVDELLLVLELADKYSVRFVFRKCKYVLQAMELSIEICEKIMHVIQVKHNMTNVSDVANTVQKFLAKEFSPLDKTWETKKFQNLSEPLLKSLLSSSDLTTQSENTVFHALMNWIKSNDYDVSNSNPGPTSRSLLTLVRFELLTINYLYHVVQHHPIATKMACFTDLYLKGITHHALPERMRNVHPAERGKVKSSMVQYTWIILKDQLETLKNDDKDKALISSELFWWCGYRMRMHLQKEAAGYYGSALIYLMAVSLPEKSEFKVSWSCKGENVSINFTDVHVFSKKQQVAQMDFSFYIPDQSASIKVSIAHSP